MEALSRTLDRVLKNSPQPLMDGGIFDFLAAERRRAELFNQTDGTLEGYDCPECKNRGCFMAVKENGELIVRPCRCRSIRAAMAAMRRSGLPPEMLEGCTWEGWETPEHWQRRALDMAQRYANAVLAGETPWFVISGVPGSGKTRLCTTIFRAIVEGGKRGLYVSWRDFARKAKSVGNDGEEFEAVVAPAKKTPVLYLDDFWKGSVNPADVNLAFELLNARYAKQLPTIISCEYTIEAIIRGDEAIGSRLFEMAEGYYIDCSRAKNWRTTRRRA